MLTEQIITIIGGGLAGSEAAHQVTKFGLKARVFEMRPKVFTPAHKTSNFGELVCSNSLKSSSLESASGVLKEEMNQLDSVIIETAQHTKIPAGQALAVDRIRFSELLTKIIEENPLIEIRREEIHEIPLPLETPLIIATGPLTSSSFSANIKKITGSSHLYFYDSISPIIDSESINYSKVFRASRYDRGETNEGDYLNCPLTREEYYTLVEELLNAQKIEIREFEKEIFFESCLPIEILAQRGKDSLRYGPMKPVGILDPRNGKRPFAVVQLRRENNECSMYNIVGFQTKLKYPEQRRVFRMIPGLENAEFLRYGSVHRNTYINSPKFLKLTLQSKENPFLLFAGQICGVEGYVESAAMGLIAGINASRLLKKLPLTSPPPETAIGSLLNYITNNEIRDFQPMNINFGLFPPIQNGVSKLVRRKMISERALTKIAQFNPNN